MPYSFKQLCVICSLRSPPSSTTSLKQRAGKTKACYTRKLRHIKSKPSNANLSGWSELHLWRRGQKSLSATQIKFLPLVIHSTERLHWDRLSVFCLVKLLTATDLSYYNIKGYSWTLSAKCRVTVQNQNLGCWNAKRLTNANKQERLETTDCYFCCRTLSIVNMSSYKCTQKSSWGSGKKDY